jgi:hypothetical protein
MNKYFLLSIAFIFSTFCLQAQTNLSGIVNEYAKVLDLDTCLHRFRSATQQDLAKVKKY